MVRMLVRGLDELRRIDRDDRGHSDWYLLFGVLRFKFARVFWREPDEPRALDSKPRDRLSHDLTQCPDVVNWPRIATT